MWYLICALVCYLIAIVLGIFYFVSEPTDLLIASMDPANLVATLLIWFVLIPILCLVWPISVVLVVFFSIYIMR